MKLNFCVISGINYLAKGITMYESLVKTGVEFNLYYVAFDEKTLKSLNVLNYQHIIPISLAQVENKELKKVKRQRKKNEYYFTLTPSIVLYIIKTFNLSQCIYVDADLYFFDSPNILLSEMGNKSVMITKHHPFQEIFHKEGKYCVQFLPFNNDSYGMKVLQWWRDKCIEWCYLRAEDGKWADQGYLNDWPERFEKIHVLKHFGAVGPWNIETSGRFFDIIPGNNKPSGKVKGTGKEFPVVFYHFQGLKVQYNDTVVLAGFEVDESFKKYIYEPYIKHLFNVDSYITGVLPEFDVMGRIPKARTLKSLVHIFKNEKTLINFAKILTLKVKHKLNFK